MQQDLLSIPRSEKPAKTLPSSLEPSSFWRSPTSLPQLSGEIAIDLETYDPYLRQVETTYLKT